MAKKAALIAAAILSVAALSAPAHAVAGGPELHCKGEACGAFTVHFGAVEWTTTAAPRFDCTSATGTGTFSSKTGGSMNLTLHGCYETLSGFKLTCTLPGLPVGTLPVGSVNFELIYLTDGKTTPGVIINGVDMTFSSPCAWATVTGSVIGHLEQTCGASQAALGINFQKSQAGHQKFMQITGTGTQLDLDMPGLGGGSAETAALEGTGTITLGQEGKLTCV